jgi:hypothetical protein
MKGNTQKRNPHLRIASLGLKRLRPIAVCTTVSGSTQSSSRPGTTGTVGSSAIQLQSKPCVQLSLAPPSHPTGQAQQGLWAHLHYKFGLSGETVNRSRRDQQIGSGSYDPFESGSNPGIRNTGSNQRQRHTKSIMPA